jgi:ATP-dependent Clp protease ATP-binding subunit ClpX
MYDLPSLDGVDEVVVNREVVEGRAQPLYTYSDRREIEAPAQGA